MSKNLSRRIYSAATASFLAVLLLIAPCKVRNSIEIALGVQQTTSLNKSKSATAPLCCTTKPKIAFVQNTKADVATPSFLTFIPNDFVTAEIHDFYEFIAEELVWEDFSPRSFTSIPYYILHQNFKVYL